MTTVHRQIPVLINRARTRASDLKSAAACLQSAEHILSSRRPAAAKRYLWNSAACQIAETWYSITRDADRAESCLLALVGRERTTSAWIEMASTLRIALGAKHFERTWDGRTRKYLIMAEEVSRTCQQWCDCARAWRSESGDRARALNCFLRAESMAQSFFDYLACAGAAGCDEEYGWLKLKQWTAKATGKAVTSMDWLRCAELVADADKFEARRCLAEAQEKSATSEGHILCAFKIDALWGAREFASVIRCLARAERSICDKNDWLRLILTVSFLLHRAERGHEPLLGAANREALRAYYNQCLKRFLNIHPNTQDWLRLAQRLQWRGPGSTDGAFMLCRAEETAQSAQDWMDCAAMWSSLKTPDAKINASLCRLRASRKGKSPRLPA